MRHFEEQLQAVLQKIVVMGTTAESMVSLAMSSLFERNEPLQREVFDKEQQVNGLQVEIDDMIVKFIARQQPVAADARFLFMASRINTELERIGDQAINICQSTHYVLEAPPLKPMVDLPIMADVAQKMLRDGLTAMVNRDVAISEQILKQEKQVDAFRDQIFRTLLTYMMADPGTIQRAMSLILISRNIERVGDHATNIAEEVIYWVQGRDVRHGSRDALPDAQPQPVPNGQAGRTGGINEQQ